MSILNKLLNWYFKKESLPYWCLLVVDSIIMMCSLLFAYWLFNRMLSTFEHRFSVLYSSLLFLVVSWMGARIFRTYLGVVRYSSFIDLLRVAYANAVSLILSLGIALLLRNLGITVLTAFGYVEIIIAFMLATLMMWGIRIVVKSLHDVSNSKNSSLLRILIYGAMTSGVGLAKNIRSQKPTKFKLCGFISHNERAKHMTLLGVKIYNIDEDIASIIKSEHIQAVLVSPTRLAKFRKNQEFQDLLIKSGVKIFIAQHTKETNMKDGNLTDEDFANMQLKEVQVEDLLPRSEIMVDMDSVGALLSGKKVLITGSAGSIGSEMVRQIAAFKPSAMMLIDQAETPEHDIRLMMKKCYPEM